MTSRSWFSKAFLTFIAGCEMRTVMFLYSITFLLHVILSLMSVVLRRYRHLLRTNMRNLMISFMPNFKCIGCSVTFIHIIFLMSSVCLILCESFSRSSWVDILSVMKLFLTLGPAKNDGCVWSEAK